MRKQDRLNFPLVEESDVDMSLQDSSPQKAMTDVIIEPNDGWVPEKISGTLWKGSQFRKVSTLLFDFLCTLMVNLLSILPIFHQHVVLFWSSQCENSGEGNYKT